MILKFRAWLNIEERYGGQEMCEVKGWDEEGEVMLYNAGDYRWDEVILMQYTGLKDKNGVEIYEGDIVEIKQQGSIAKYIPNNSVNEIVYKDSAFCVKETWGIGSIEWPIIAGLYYKASEEFEVLGNVYENPELLEAAE